MKQITTENIALIKTICINHGITFYDIQLEAIDHIASMVEARWEEHPDEDFEVALSVVKSKIDWRPFRYKHDYYIDNQFNWNIHTATKDEKNILIVSFSYLIIVAIMLYFDIGGDYRSVSIDKIAIIFSCAFVTYFACFTIWLSYKFYKVQHYISNMYPMKYWLGIIAGFLLTWILTLFLISDWNTEHSFRSMLFNVMQWSFIVYGTYIRYVKVIRKAESKYPQLFN